ncbi:hypothetical protein M8312_08255 [Sphingomonas sp. KRR8]|uniref:hypothetical protein n=1 Tax=Sphingomonas sp. KRR8 TaxID=2942996 RepID=UPI002020B191|nr:hypothetical protein [Sphingomonas sp. KRR8]URD59808.1 hypothetical protein M8312_08255 [Sphingomonas sp. KRR8]
MTIIAKTASPPIAMGMKPSLLLGRMLTPKNINPTLLPATMSRLPVLVICCPK